MTLTARRPIAPAGSPWRLVAALAGLNVLSFVDRQLLAAVAPLLIAELGLSRAQVGLLLGAAFILVYAVGTLVAGALTDRASRRHPGAPLVALAALGAVGLAATFVFYRVAPGSGLFFGAWALAQAWLLGWFGPVVATIDEMAPAGLRASVIGFGLLVVAVLGVASGAYITGLIGDRVSLTAGLLWSLVPAAAGVLLVGVVGVAQMRRA